MLESTGNKAHSAVPNVLYVDAVAGSRRLFERAFNKTAFTIHTCSSPLQALGLLEFETFDVIATNLRLPHVDGAEVLAEAKRLQPAARRVLLTTVSEFEKAIRAVRRAGVHRFLCTPWRVHEMRATVADMLEHSAAEAERPDLGTDLGRSLLTVLLEALEARDSELRWHSERTAIYAVTLASALGLHESEFEDLKRGALLHDLGKIGIPDRLFLKPGALDVCEWAQMKQHPGLGANMLCEIPELAGARRVVMEHHERWDGLGYPVGLKGPEISINARVFAVADALDAMTSVRIYRDALSFEEAWNELLIGAGSQFDPAVVAALECLGPEFWVEMVSSQQRRSSWPAAGDVFLTAR